MSRAKYRTICFPKVKAFLKVLMACFCWSLKPAKMELFCSARMEKLGTHDVSCCNE
jgi:hypothetical protein